uniref:(California timema) hypothetical protein n=1 Tax=Timema californicum TaxID=61474 RepID=A0A7R9IXH6_TIMCA|nr:unnamed protein product [Timema californicum]
MIATQVTSSYSSPMASLVLIDSFEKLPDQMTYPYAELDDLQKHILATPHPIGYKFKHSDPETRFHLPDVVVEIQARCMAPEDDYGRVIIIPKAAGINFPRQWPVTFLNLPVTLW